MRRICMVCGRLFGLKAPFEDDRETHGLCPECFDLEMKKIEQALTERQKVSQEDGI